MRYESRESERGFGRGATRTIGLSVFCMALIGGLAVAAARPPGAKPAGEPEPKAKPVPITEVKPKPIADPTKKVEPSKSKTIRRGKPTKARRKNVKLDPNPNAKWVCDKTEVSVDPVWRGDGRLTFGFDIRNEGTEDLKIKASGG